MQISRQWWNLNAIETHSTDAFYIGSPLHPARYKLLGGLTWMPPLPASAFSHQEASTTLLAARESSRGGERWPGRRDSQPRPAALGLAAGWSRARTSRALTGSSFQPWHPARKLGAGCWGAARSGGMWGWAERVGEGAEGEGLGKDVCRRISAALWAVRGDDPDAASCWKTTKRSRVRASLVSEKCLAGHGVLQPVS